MSYPGDGHYLVRTDTFPDHDGQLSEHARICGTSRQHSELPFSGNGHPPSCIQLSKDDRLALVGYESGNAFVYTFATGARTYLSNRFHLVNSVSMSADGSYLVASASDQGPASIWDMRTGAMAGWRDHAAEADRSAAIQTGKPLSRGRFSCPGWPGNLKALADLAGGGRTLCSHRIAMPLWCCADGTLLLFGRETLQGKKTIVSGHSTSRAAKATLPALADLGSQATLHRLHGPPTAGDC